MLRNIKVSKLKVISIHITKLLKFTKLKKPDSKDHRLLFHLCNNCNKSISLNRKFVLVITGNGGVDED